MGGAGRHPVAVPAATASSLKFVPAEPIEKLVRLTVFTEKGCSVTLEKLINIEKPDD